MALKKYVLKLFLIFIAFFIISPFKITAEIPDGCRYSNQNNGTDNLMVNSSLEVFSVKNVDNKFTYNKLGTVNVTGAPTHDRNFTPPTNCPQLFYYDLPGSSADIYSVSPCKMESAMDVDDFIKTCSFLLDHITVKPSPYGFELSERTLREAIDEYYDSGRLNFKTTSIEKSCDETWYKKVSLSDITKEQEEEAQKIVNQRMSGLTSCIKANHASADAKCSSDNYEEYLSCVKNEVGANFQCNNLESAYQEAVVDLDAVREYREIQLNFEKLSCEEILGDDLIDLLKQIFFWIQMIGISIVVVLSMLDFMKAVASSKEDEMKKVSGRLSKRIIILIILLLLPVLVMFVLELLGGNMGLDNYHPFCE